MHPMVILNVVRHTVIHGYVALLDLLQVAHQQRLSQTIIQREIVVVQVWHPTLSVFVLLILRKRKR